ncbi:MAG: proline--tRNA ligase [Myxococcota bacterium]|nr:proline--tRNA ligase [Myxococcota bacterium]
MSKKTAITPTREDNYPEWYQQVVKAADLAEVSPVRGCMVIKPWGYALWENIQADLDRRFKETGHVNAYFPLFIPKSFLEKEAEHVDGFAKECAVVTHHRLEEGPDGGLVPAGELEEPLVVRPTSETIIGAMFSKWVQSYRDLPILINQWANVVRWEMRTRVFLRTAEFLWQEGHTVHQTAEEAIAETKQMLGVYTDFVEEMMAMPVVPGAKTLSERFPGAVDTYSIEAMMQDRKALQAGTSHFLGQNFARAQAIQYLSSEGRREYAWTTSWGVSTRLVGALIMTHSDDDGLVLPPKLAPSHIVIIPIHGKGKDPGPINDYCASLAEELGALTYNGSRLKVKFDQRDMRGGDKNWDHIKKGVPIRLEIGPRDMENDAVFMGRRDLGPREKASIPRKEFIARATTILDEIQQALFERARSRRDEASAQITNVDDFHDFFGQGPGGFAWCYAADNASYEHILAPYKVTPRCIPIHDNDETGDCIFTGAPGQRKIVFAKSY